ncbi:MAG TPA: hypothetical protein VEP89_03185 [Draconibacterium sp.]|nr:hypothetical protein [Draconibacterium sp.]
MKKVIIALTLVATIGVVIATAKTNVIPSKKSNVTVVEATNPEHAITKEKEEKKKKTEKESTGCSDAQKKSCEKSGQTCGSKKDATAEKSCCGGK